MRKRQRIFVLRGRLSKSCMPHMIGKPQVKDPKKKKDLHSISELLLNPQAHV
jgi:hypothetical protein